METFEARITAADRGGAYVRVPADVVAALGGAGRIPVRATFDGIAYRGSVVSMGGEKVIGLLQAIRTQLGKAPGDMVTVTLEADTAERSVVMPHDLRAALAAAGVLDAFAALSYSHQRQHVGWIDEAKRPETRARRIRQTVERLQVG
jgi:hypothetical protein